MDGRMVENIQSIEGNFGGHFVDFKYQEDGHLHKATFGRVCKRGIIRVKKPQSGLNFSLQVIDVKSEGK